jgi:hypothetical protein
MGKIRKDIHETAISPHLNLSERYKTVHGGDILIDAILQKEKEERVLSYITMLRADKLLYAIL